MSIDRTLLTALVDDDGSNTLGSVVTKAVLGSVIFDPVDAAILAGTPRTCRVGNASGTLSIPASTVTAITFATEAFDTTGMHDPAVNPSRVTAAVAGTYLAVGGLFWTAQAIDSATFLLARLAKSGTVIEGSRSYYPPISSLATNGMAQNVSAVIDLTVGQYVQLEAFHDSVSARTVNLASCSLQLVYLGP
jgi:hypothetical protein